MIMRATTSPRLVLHGHHLPPCTFADAPCMGFRMAGTSPTYLLYWIHLPCLSEQHWDMPWHVRPSGVVFAIAAESGHATACPYRLWNFHRHSASLPSRQGCAFHISLGHVCRDFYNIYYCLLLIERIFTSA